MDVGRSPHVISTFELSSAKMSQDMSFASIEPSEIQLKLRPGAFDNITYADLESVPYEDIRADDIRKLTAKRKLQCPTTMGKADRIIRLRMFDKLARSYLELMGRELPGVPDDPRKPRRTSGAMFRLLNILFSDEFSDRFAATGKQRSREEIDSGESEVDKFWRDVAAAQQEANPDWAAFVDDHPSFAAVDMVQIQAYTDEQLRGFWKDLRKEYREISMKYRQSGTHEADFSRFTRTRVDALYLWLHLKQKPNLTDFVNGGLREEDHYDSLSRRLHPERYSNESTTPTRASTKRSASDTTPGSARKRAKTTTPTRSSPRKSGPPQSASKAAKPVAPSPSTPLAFDDGDGVAGRALQRMMTIVEGYFTVTSSVRSMTANERLAAFALHSDLGKRIAEIERTIPQATGTELERLQNDLDMYTQERDHLSQTLRSK